MGGTDRSSCKHQGVGPRRHGATAPGWGRRGAGEEAKMGRNGLQKPSGNTNSSMRQRHYAERPTPLDAADFQKPAASAQRDFHKPERARENLARSLHRLHIATRPAYLAVPSSCRCSAEADVRQPPRVKLRRLERRGQLAVPFVEALHGKGTPHSRERFDRHTPAALRSNKHCSGQPTQEHCRSRHPPRSLPLLEHPRYFGFKLFSFLARLKEK